MGDSLVVSTVLNFMYLVFDVNVLANVEYSRKWRTPGYNFYVKKYQVYREKNTLWIKWVNLNGERKFMLYRVARPKSSFMQKLYFLFHKQYDTDDNMRGGNVLLHVVYPEFCKELGISADFSKLSSVQEASDLVMCYLYENFFTSVTLDYFIDMFNLRGLLNAESMNFIRNHVSASVS